MTSLDLRNAVVAALGRIAPELDPATLQSGAPLREQVDIDSMDFLNFVVALAERFGVDIPEADYAALSSLDAIVAYLSAKIDKSTDRS